MVFGHNLHYVVPFGIPWTGFCMVFQPASFVFFMPGGRLLSLGSDFLISGRHFGPGTFLGWKMGPEKSGFATESFCGGNSGKFLWPKWILLYIYRIHLGRLLCPKPSLFNSFQGISRFSGKLVGPWDLPCVFPIALRDPVALFPLFGVYDGVIWKRCCLISGRSPEYLLANL